jgi:hypothetical protein
MRTSGSRHRPKDDHHHRLGLHHQGSGHRPRGIRHFDLLLEQGKAPSKTRSRWPWPNCGTPWVFVVGFSDYLQWRGALVCTNGSMKLSTCPQPNFGHLGRHSRLAQECQGWPAASPYVEMSSGAYWRPAGSLEDGISVARSPTLWTVTWLMKDPSRTRRSGFGMRSKHPHNTAHGAFSMSLPMRVTGSEQFSGKT